MTETNQSELRFTKNVVGQSRCVKTDLAVIEGLFFRAGLNEKLIC